MASIQSQVSADQVSGFFQKCREVCLEDSLFVDLDFALSSLREVPVPRGSRRGGARERSRRGLFSVEREMPVPDCLREKMDGARTLSRLGVFPEIGHAWVSVDNELFLYDYLSGTRIRTIVADTVIQYALLFSPRPGVFSHDARYCLLVGLSDHVRIYALLFPSDFLEAVTLVGRTSAAAAGGAGLDGGAQLGLRPVETNSYYLAPEVAGAPGLGQGQRGLIPALEFTISDTGLSCPLQSGVKITCMEASASPSSRLFLGMTDGEIYELCYESSGQGGQVSSKLVCRTSIPVISHVPFVNELLNKRSVKQICIDSPRGVLYALHENDRISSYLFQPPAAEEGGPAGRLAAYARLPPAEAYFRRLRPYTTLAQDLTSHSQPPGQICQIRVVTRSESKTIHLVASLQSGAQVYFTLLPGFQSTHHSRLYTGDLRDSSAISSAGQQMSGLDDGLSDQICSSSILTVKHIVAAPQFGGSGPSASRAAGPDGAFGVPEEGPPGPLSVYGYTRSSGCEFFYATSGLYASVLDLSYYRGRGKESAHRSGELVEEVVAHAGSDVIIDVVELQPSAIREFSDSGFSGSPGQASGWSTGAPGTGAFSGFEGAVSVPLHPSLMATNQLIYQYSSPGRMFVVLSASTVYVLRLRRPVDFVIDSLAETGSLDPALTSAWGKEELSAMLLSLALGSIAPADGEGFEGLEGTRTASSASFLRQISQRASAIFVAQFAELGYQGVLLYTARLLRPVLAETFWVASDAQAGNRSLLGAAGLVGSGGMAGFSGTGMSVAMAPRTMAAAAAPGAGRAAGLGRELARLVMGIVSRSPDVENDLHALSVAGQTLSPGIIGAKDAAAISSLRLTNSQLRWSPVQVFGLSLSLSMLTTYLRGPQLASQVTDYDYRLSTRQIRPGGVQGGFAGEYGQPYAGGAFGRGAQLGSQQTMPFHTLIDSIAYAREVLVFVSLITDPSRLAYSAAVLNRFAKDYGQVVYISPRSQGSGQAGSVPGPSAGDEPAPAASSGEPGPGLLSRLLGGRWGGAVGRKAPGDRAFFVCDLLSVPGLLRPEAQPMVEELVRILSVGGAAPVPGGVQAGPASQASVASTRVNPRRQMTSQRFLVQLEALCPTIHQIYSVRIRGLALLAAAGAPSTSLAARNENIAEAIRLFTTLQLSIEPLEPILQSLVDLHASGHAIRLALAVARGETYNTVEAFAEKSVNLSQQLQNYKAQLLGSGVSLFEELVGIRGDQGGIYARLGAFYNALLQGTYSELYPVKTFISSVVAQLTSLGGGFVDPAAPRQDSYGRGARGAPSDKPNATSLTESVEKIRTNSVNIFSILQSVYLFVGISDVISNPSPGIQGNQAVEAAVTGCSARLWHYELYCWLYSHYYHLGCIAAGLRAKLGLGDSAGDSGDGPASPAAGRPGAPSGSLSAPASASRGRFLSGAKGGSDVPADFQNHCSTVLTAVELVQKRCKAALTSIQTPHIEGFLHLFDYELHVSFLERRGSVMNACQTLYHRATDPATEAVFPRLVSPATHGGAPSLRASARAGTAAQGEVSRSLCFSARRALLTQAHASLQSPTVRMMEMQDGGVGRVRADSADQPDLLRHVREQLQVARFQQAILDRLRVLCYVAAGQKPRRGRGGPAVREELNRSISAGLGCSALAGDQDDALLGSSLPQLEEASRRLEEDGLATLDGLRDDFALRFRMYDIAVVVLLQGVQSSSAWNLQLSQVWIQALTKDIPGYAALGRGGEEPQKASSPLCDVRALLAEAQQVCPGVADALDPAGDAFRAVTGRALRMGVVLANILLMDPPLKEESLILPSAVVAAYVLQFRDSLLQSLGGLQLQGTGGLGGAEGAGGRSSPAEAALRLLCDIAFDSFTHGLFRANQVGVDYKNVIPMMIFCIRECLLLICNGLRNLDIASRAMGAGNLRGAPFAAPLTPMEADRHFEALYVKLPDSMFRSLDKRALGHALCYLWKYLAVTFTQLVSLDPFDQGGMAKVSLPEQREGIAGFLAMLNIEDRGLAGGKW